MALHLEDEILARFRRLTGRTLTSMRIRTHGDYHLGQLLYTGNDFLITDFEGEPARSLAERKLKRSALRDVAGMLRSFDYAVHSALSEQRQSGLNEEMARVAREWGQLWQAWVSVEFLRSYLESVRDASILKAPPDEIEVLLSTYVLEKVVYELAYELNNRPDWLIVPLRGMLELVQSGP